MSVLDSSEINITEHVDSVNYSKDYLRLGITFNQRPENWEPSHKLVFSNVTDFNKEVLDDEGELGVDNFTGLVLEFSESSGSYYLHLSTTEFTFKTSELPVCVGIV